MPADSRAPVSVGGVARRKITLLIERLAFQSVPDMDVAYHLCFLGVDPGLDGQAIRLLPGCCGAARRATRGNLPALVTGRPAGRARSGCNLPSLERASAEQRGLNQKRRTRTRNHRWWLALGLFDDEARNLPALQIVKPREPARILNSSNGIDKPAFDPQHRSN